MTRLISVALSVVSMMALLAGCASRATLPVPPNVLRDGSGTVQLEQLPERARTPDMRVLYVTDRQNAGPGRRGDEYAFGRSTTLSYGWATVRLGGRPSWDELARYSGSQSTSARYSMAVTKIEEAGQLLPVVRHLVSSGDGLHLDTQAMQQEEKDAQKALSAALADAPVKDVYLYVHGFANTFDDAVLRTASVWHYVGRRGVAIAYTWPAGRGGLLGYFYDRESGEFTVYHLKRALRMIAACPDVQNLHVIAHSRGTDVLITALRELNAEFVGARRDPHLATKIKTLVLAAPDLDLDVFAMRFGSENLVAMARQTVIYTAREDAAIAVARWLFGGRGRLGSINPDESSPEAMRLISLLSGFEIVRTDVSGYSSSHAYVFSNPAAMSDLVLVLRDGRPAGAENGRPLQKHVGWWFLDDAYLRNRATAR